MTVYWFVCISILMLSAAAQRADYEYDGILTNQRRCHKKNARFYYVLCSLILVFVAGCRFFVGDDFPYYYNYTNNLDFWGALKTLQEPGLHLVNSIATEILPTGQFCIFCAAALTLGLQLWVIYQNTDRIGMAVFLFTLISWHYSFNGVRQALAAGVLFCGFPALRDRKYVEYSAFVLLAFLFHRSALVMIGAALLAHRKINLRYLFLIAAVSIVFLMSYQRVFAAVNLILGQTVDLTDSYWSKQVHLLRPLSRAAPACFFLLVYFRRRNVEIEAFYLNLLLLDAVVAVVAMNSAAMSRMSIYTAPFSVLSIVELVKLFSVKTQRILNKGIVMFYLAFFVVECRKFPFAFDHLRWLW